MTPRRRRQLIAATVFGAIAAGALAMIVLWNRNDAHQVTLDEARRRLHSTSTEAGGVTAPLRPATGVYRYTGSGTDRLDTPPKEQTEGPDMPATVSDEPGGCWRFRIDYSSNHWQSWVYCPTGGGLEERGGQTYQKWDFVVFANESTTTFTCDSSVTIRADQHPGDEWQQSCHDVTKTTSVSSGTYRFVGDEHLTVDGRSVTAHRYHRDRTMVGDQVGQEHSDVWFAVDSGLPVRNQRTITVKTSTVVGDVTYREDANFQLASLDPTG